MIKIIFRRGKFHFVPYTNMGRGVLVLFGMVTSIHILTAALNIKKGDRNRGMKALAIARKAGTSIWVIIGIGTITTLLADIAAFNAATGQKRKDIWDRINITLKDIMRKFQSASENNPRHSAEIIESGGFSVRSVYKKQKIVFSVTQGVKPGTVELTGDTCDGDHLHDWWMSENGIDWDRLKPTTEYYTTVKGLKTGQRYWFRHQLVRPVTEKDGPLKEGFLDVI